MYLMVSSPAYRNVFVYFESGIIRAVSGPAELVKLVNEGVDWVKTAEEEEIRRIHAMAGGDSGPGGPLLHV